MILEATVNDAGRIAEIEVSSSRYAYKGVVADECLFRDLNVESRVPVYERWISEKRSGNRPVAVRSGKKKKEK